MENTYILKSGKKSIELAAKWIVEGKIVAFPTETVYGLGANALNEESCLEVFRMKGRPLTDPLIVHCWNIDQAKLCI